MKLTKKILLSSLGLTALTIVVPTVLTSCTSDNGDNGGNNNGGDNNNNGGNNNGGNNNNSTNKIDNIIDFNKYSNYITDLTDNDPGHIKELTGANSMFKLTMATTLPTGLQQQNLSTKLNITQDQFISRYNLPLIETTLLMEDIGNIYNSAQQINKDYLDKASSNISSNSLKEIIDGYTFLSINGNDTSKMGNISYSELKTEIIDNNNLVKKVAFSKATLTSDSMTISSSAFSLIVYPKENYTWSNGLKTLVSIEIEFDMNMPSFPTYN